MPKGVYNINRDKNDWETPPDLFRLGCDFFHIAPILDVCATAQTSKCKWHYETDGLDREYNYDFYCNPPYNDVKKWIRYCYLQHVKHNVSGLMLIFAKTDTRAWHDYIFGKAEILFIRGRVHFYDKGIPSKNPAPYGSAFICYRKKI